MIIGLFNQNVVYPISGALTIPHAKLLYRYTNLLDERKLYLEKEIQSEGRDRNRMNKVVSIELVWHYTPENYFGRPVTIPIEGGKIQIAKGQVTAIIDSSGLNGNNEFIDTLDNLVENQFWAIQNDTHAPYELSNPIKIEIRDDGSENPCLV